MKPALLVCAILLSGCFDMPTDTSSSGSYVSRAAVAPLVVIPTSVQELTGAYEENEPAADDTYKGANKWVTLSGKIGSIKKNFMDQQYLVLTSGKFLHDIHCEAADGTSFANVRKGQTVQVRGQVKTYIMGSVMVGNCSLVN